VKLYHGWRLFAFEPFAERLRALKEEVERLRARDPQDYRRHPTTVLLATVYKAITELVPSNPNQPEFRVGHSLGPDCAHWRHVRRGLPPRYRLFFRFSSQPARIIIYAWLNDEATLRKAGAKTDVYAVFQRMLRRGEVPSDIEELKKRGSAIDV
jgi:toxin YhaV